MTDERPALSLTLHLYGEPGEAPRDRAAAWLQSHGPLLDAIERNPRLRVGLVLAGELVPHWEESHPERLERIRALVQAGRVELVGTPLFEPVLSSIPERDGTGQMLAHAMLLKRVFEVRPEGTWLPYRVWDPGLPPVLERADLRWCLVDDTAIARHHPGKPDPWGAWWTERGGYPVLLLGTDARALEMSGEVPVADLLVYARGRSVQGAKVQYWALPAARFGLRTGRDPATDQAWLGAFLDGLDAATHLDLCTPSEGVKRCAARGRTYLPSWAPAGRDLPWERHLVQVPEADRLHKKMLRVSRQVARLSREADGSLPADSRPDPDAALQAERYLYRAQGASAYRPGDDPAIRGRAWHDLLRAEREVLRARGASERLVAEVADLDATGRKQVLLRTGSLCAVVDPEGSGGLTELSSFDVARNLVDTFSRVPSERHGTDLRPRRALVEHFLPPDLDLEAVHARSPEDHATWTVVSTDRRTDRGVRAVLSRDVDVVGPEGTHGLSLVKTISVRTVSRLDWAIELANRDPEPARFRFAVELTLTPCADLGEASLRCAGAVLRADRSRRLIDVERLEVHGPGVVIGVGFKRPARVATFPVRSVRPSGEVLDQGVCVYAEWPIQLLPRDRDRLAIKIEVGS